MSKYEFPRQRRLLTAEDFRYVFAQAEYKISHRNLLILARTSHASQSRLGLVIAKKHVKRAVDRNHIKRALRESFRTSLPAFRVGASNALNTPLDIVVLARPGIASLTPPDLNTVIYQQWQRLCKKAKANHLEEVTNDS